MSIKPLPCNAIAQIKASTGITSLNEVVCELLKNSLDACATKVDLSVDYDRGACFIEDNGHGILPFEFQETGNLGKAYHTSKLNNKASLHGCKGMFLYNLSFMATITITSRHKFYQSHNSLRINRSEVISRQIPAPPQNCLQFRHGTRVIMHDLFRDMPVRVKQRAMNTENNPAYEMEWDELILEVVQLLLPWPTSVLVTVRETSTNKKISLRCSLPLIDKEVEISKIHSILCQTSLVTTEEIKYWIAVEAEILNFNLRGSISLLPSATKNCQFLSFGIKPVPNDCNILYDEINRLFISSTFGCAKIPENLGGEENQLQDKYRGKKKPKFTSLKMLKNSKKGVEKWPKFYLNIQNLTILDDADGSNADNSIFEAPSASLHTLMNLLQTTISEFLKANNFCPKYVDWLMPIPEESSKSSIPLPRKHGNQTATSGAVSKIIPKKLNPLHDPLGTKIKLPSFFRDIRETRCALDPGSKTRIGAATIKWSTPRSDVISKSIVQPQIQQDSVLLSNSSSLKETIPRKQLALISYQDETSVEHVHSNCLSQPFDDVTVCPKFHPKSPQRDEIHHSSHSLVAKSNYQLNEVKNDDIITWINPITRNKTEVNQRSGFVAKSPQRTLNNSIRIPWSEAVHAKIKPDEAGPWIRQLLETWDNPIFLPAKKAIPSILKNDSNTTPNLTYGRHHYGSETEVYAFDNSFRLNIRISRNALKEAQVIAQVDKKFILIKLYSSPDETGKNPGEILALVDQHAADERVRIESLLEELCSATRTHSKSSPIQVNKLALEKPLIFKLSVKEIQLLSLHKVYFFRWGIFYELPEILETTCETDLQSIKILTLPLTIVKRCLVQPELLISLLRTEILRLQERCTSIILDSRGLESGNWVHRIHNCPVGILDLLNSRACRSAVMFNDDLSRESCEALVRRLAKCVFPFQCAHGRPSMVPLVSMTALNSGRKNDYNSSKIVSDELKLFSVSA